MAFQTTLERAGGATREAHNLAANRALIAEMERSPEFATAIKELGIEVRATQSSPRNWSWHHVKDQPGVMQLVPRHMHQGGEWHNLFHPGGVGGFKIWGKEF